MVRRFQFLLVRKNSKRRWFFSPIFPAKPKFICHQRILLARLKSRNHGTDLRRDGTRKETGATRCLHGLMGVLRESRLPFTSVRMDCSIRLETRLPCPSRKRISTVVGLRSGSGGRDARACLLASSVSCKLSEPSANVVICVGQRERK